MTEYTDSDKVLFRRSEPQAIGPGPIERDIQALCAIAGKQARQRAARNSDPAGTNGLVIPDTMEIGGKTFSPRTLCIWSHDISDPDTTRATSFTLIVEFGEPNVISRDGSRLASADT